MSEDDLRVLKKKRTEARKPKDLEKLNRQIEKLEKKIAKSKQKHEKVKEND
jgi:phage shock protein A